MMMMMMMMVIIIQQCMSLLLQCVRVRLLRQSLAFIFVRKLFNATESEVINFVRRRGDAVN